MICPRRSARFAFTLAVIWSTTLAALAATEPGADERARIGAERSAAQARFLARDAECRNRFVVSACLEDARRERRATLDSLRTRQLVIDEARRKERTEQRRAELATKSADDAKREQERATKSGAAASSPSVAEGASAARPTGRPLEARHEARPSARAPNAVRDRRANSGEGLWPRSKPSGETAAQRQARETQSRAGFDRRHEQAAKHREEALAAAAKRTQQHASGRSLPTPAAAASSP